MRKYLACCEEIEQRLSDVYRYWQQVYHDDQEFSVLWGTLADDELNHVSQIKLARRLQGDGLFKESTVDSKSIEKLLATARKLLVDVQKITLSKEKALRTAIKMEEAFNQAHMANVGAFVNPSIQAMFTSLAREDAKHIATLQAFCDQVFGKD